MVSQTEEGITDWGDRMNSKFVLLNPLCPDSESEAMNPITSANDDALVQEGASHSASTGDGTERTDTAAKGSLKAARSPESVLFGKGPAEPGVRLKKGKAARVTLPDETSSVTSATDVVAPTEVTFQIVIPGDDESEENESQDNYKLLHTTH